VTGVVLKHKLADRGHDLYETPIEATIALMRAEKLPHWIWEPAAGRGAISTYLSGWHAVVAHDLVNYGPHLEAFGRDFLMETKRPFDWIDTIVTNPPYKLAADFVRHGLELCPTVIMLLRLSFLESEGRSDILDGGKLARVHVFRNRLPQMHRDGWEGPKASSAIPFAWFVWDSRHTGPATINRISWRHTAM